jgi:hypothetical protein
MDVAAIDCKNSFSASMTELQDKKLIENLENGGVLLVPLEMPSPQPTSEITERPKFRTTQSIVVQTLVRLTDGSADVDP